MRETSQAIRKRMQAARDIQRARFSRVDSKHPIFCNADMRVGEIRQFCKLQVEALGFDAGGDESDELVGKSLSSHLVEALHALQSSEVDDRVKIHVSGCAFKGFQSWPKFVTNCVIDLPQKGVK